MKMTDSKDVSFATEEIYSTEEHEKEEPEEVHEFALELILFILEKIFPDNPKPLSLKKARECLKIVGKIWNLSEYPPTNYVEEIINNKNKERLMDMEGYVDEYQYLHIEAVNMDLTDVKVIPKNFVWLLSVDVSGNRLTNVSACALSKLPNIVALKLNKNKIKDPYLPPMKHLQYLSLEFNKIESLHRIYHPNLETLNLNFNRIRRIDRSDCWKLSKLTQLELRGNFLKTISRLEYSTLVNLYLAENQISEIKGMEILVNLERLHLRSNPISHLLGFTKSNIKLSYLNLRNCLIPNVEEIEKLKVLIGLRELIVINNIFKPELKNKGIKKNKHYKKGYDTDVNEESNTDDDESDDDDDEREDQDDKIQSEEEEDLKEQDKAIRIQILLYLPYLQRIDKKTVTKEELQIAKDAENNIE